MRTTASRLVISSLIRAAKEPSSGGPRFSKVKTGDGAQDPVRRTRNHRLDLFEVRMKMR